VEGCIQGVTLYVEPLPLQALGDLGKHVAAVATECLVLPPFETPGWCRIGLHGIQVYAPVPSTPADGTADPKSSKLPDKASDQKGGLLLSVPTVLITNVPGFGEILSALEALPAAPRWLPPVEPGSAATARGRSGGAEDSTTLAQQPSGALEAILQKTLQRAKESQCSCGHELADGAVCLAKGFQPIRTLPCSAPGKPVRGSSSSNSGGVGSIGSSGSPATAEGGSTGPDSVAVARKDFMDLIRTHVAAVASRAMLPQLEELHAEAPALNDAPDSGGEEQGEGAEAAADAEEDEGGIRATPSDATFSQAPLGSDAPMRKKKSRAMKFFSKLGGHHSSSDKADKDKGDKTDKKKAGKDGSSDLDARASQLASRWAELEETVRRLRAERTETALRNTALRRASDEEVAWQQRCLREAERTTSAKIARQRAEQAELSAKAAEQHAAIERLLRRLPAQRERIASAP